MSFIDVDIEGGIKLHVSERKLQIDIFKWIRDQGLEDFNKIYSTDVAGHKKNKALGAVTGIPDIHWPLARDGYSSLWIELKVKSNRCSLEQMKYINWLRDNNHLVLVRRSYNVAISDILSYYNNRTDMIFGKESW